MSTIDSILGIPGLVVGRQPVSNPFSSMRTNRCELLQDPLSATCSTRKTTTNKVISNVVSIASTQITTILKMLN